MRKYALLFLLIFLLLSACDDKLLKPTEFVPKYPIKAPIFERSHLMDANGKFFTGYSNFNIRRDRVNLSWEKCTDSDFECYRLYRNNSFIREFRDANQLSFTDTLLTSNTFYHYSIASKIRSGMSKSDTLTIKTPSLASPTLLARINQQNKVVFYWKDNSEIPGKFILKRDNEEIHNVEGIFPPNPNNYYNYIDSSVNHYSYYGYSLYKKGIYDSTSVTNRGITVSYNLNAPTLLNLTQIAGSTNVRVSWRDNSSGETAFRVYRKKLEDMNYSLIYSTSIFDQEEYVDQSSALRVGSTYLYYVTAIDSDTPQTSESNHSATMQITIGDDSTVTWRIALKDSYGDGWGDSFLSLRINGALKDYIYMGYGAGPEYYDFEVKNGDFLQIYYYDYDYWSDENYYALIDHNNNRLAESGGTWNDPGQTIPGNILWTVNLNGKQLAGKSNQRSSQ